MADTTVEITNRPRSDSEVAYRKIFIGGLSFSTDEEKLKKYFKQYGVVQDAVVMKDPVSKRSRGFGFITFVDINSVDSALADEPHTIDARKVEAKRAVPRSELPRESVAVSSTATSTSKASPTSTTMIQQTNSNINNTKSSLTTTSQPNSNTNITTNKSNVVSNTSTNSNHNISIENRPDNTSHVKHNFDEYAYNKIFAGGLHYDTRDAEFRSYFEHYGKVISAEVMFNRETHKSRGFGFIVYELEQSAIKVCDVKEHVIDGKEVEVKRAIPRSKLPAGTPTSSILAMNLNATSTTSTNKSISGGGTVVNSTSTIHHSTPRPATTTAVSMLVSSTNSPSQLTSHNSSSHHHHQTSANSTMKSFNPTLVNTVTASRSASATSYAAALKLGTSTNNLDGYEEPLLSQFSSNTNTLLSSNTKSTLSSLNPNSAMNLQTFTTMYSKIPSAIDISINRPYRSNSEPIVNQYTEGSAILNGEILSGERLFNRTGTTIGTSLSSNASSRSGSISSNFISGTNDNNQAFTDDSLHALINNSNNTTNKTNTAVGNVTSSPSLGNIPWLSSPPRQSLEESLHTTTTTGGGVPLGLQLPPAASVNKVMTSESSPLANNASSINPGIASTGAAPGLPHPQVFSTNNGDGIQMAANNGIWFPVPLSPANMQQMQMQMGSQQAFQQAAAMQQQQFMGMGMMYMSPGNPPQMQYIPLPQMPQQLQQLVSTNGGAPSPDMWALMLNSQQQAHQQAAAVAAMGGNHDQLGNIQQMSPPPGYPQPPHYVMPQQFPYFTDSNAFNTMNGGTNDAQQQQQQQMQQQFAMQQQNQMMFYPQLQSQQPHMPYAPYPIQPHNPFQQQQLLPQQQVGINNNTLGKQSFSTEQHVINTGVINNNNIPYSHPNQVQDISSASLQQINKPPGENSETDEIFTKFSELNLNSPEYIPNRRNN